jgi:subtilisin family serine protease
MSQRFLYGVCIAALLGVIIRDSWTPTPISPHAVVGTASAHQRALTGKGAIVAVLDEGFDSSHLSLKDQFSPLHRHTTQSHKSQDISESLIFENGRYIFDSHGTHVSGIISSLAPQSQIIPIKIEGFDGDQTFVKALELAAKSPAHIVNISMRLSYTGRELSPNVRTALLELAQSGKLIVIAAGNDAIPLMKSAYTASLVELSHHPLMEKSLLLVGASTYKNGIESLAEFSNFPGKYLCKTFITAPGDQINSTVTGGSFGEKSGTSMAAPMVAGAACLLKQAYPHLSAKELGKHILKTARTMTTEGTSLSPTQFGVGVLDLKAALRGF